MFNLQPKWSVAYQCNFIMNFNFSFVYFCGYAGLNVEIDRILEIACIITDGNLTKTLEVFSLCTFIHDVAFCCTYRDIDTEYQNTFLRNLFEYYSTLARGGGGGGGWVSNGEWENVALWILVP
jgi:hypothetical protein